MDIYKKYIYIIHVMFFFKLLLNLYNITIKVKSKGYTTEISVGVHIIYE